MDDHYVNAVKLALRQIDANRNQYNDTTRQHDMLQDLIDTHHPKSVMQVNGVAHAAELTAQRYMKLLLNMMSRREAKPRKDRNARNQLFMEGSFVIQGEYLRQIGYNRSKLVQMPSTQATRPTEPTTANVNVSISLDTRNQSRRSTRSTTSTMQDIELSAQSLPEAVRLNRRGIGSSSSSISSISNQSDIIHELTDLPQQSNSRDSVDARRSTGGPNEATADSGPDLKRLPGDHEVLDAQILLPSTPTVTDFLDEEQAFVSNSDQPASIVGEKRKCQDSDVNIAASKRIQTEIDFEDRSKEGSIAPRNKSHEPEPSSSATRIDSQSRIDTDQQLHLRPLPAVVILECLNKLKSLARSVAIYILQDLGVHLTSLAIWIPVPTMALQTLYRTILGNDWQRQALLSHARGITAFELVQSLITVAWFRILLVEDMPLSGPAEWMKPLEDVETYIDLVLQRHGVRSVNVRMLFSEAFQEELQQGGNENSRLSKAAEDRAWTFLLTIEPQLGALGGFHCPEHSNDLWQLKAKEMANVFREALVLKGLMSSSSHYYEHEWIESGTIIDEQKMMQPHESNRAGVVKFCVGPAIWLKKTIAGERIELCKADVIPANRS